MGLAFSDDTREQVIMLLTQINDAIDQLIDWNIDVKSEDDYYLFSYPEHVINISIEK